MNVANPALIKAGLATLVMLNPLQIKLNLIKD